MGGYTTEPFCAEVHTHRLRDLTCAVQFDGPGYVYVVVFRK